MKKASAIMCCSLLALMFVIVGASSAYSPTRTPGVSAGDSLIYGDLSVYWYSNDSSATPPPGFYDLLNVSMFVDTVVGTNITGSFTRNYVNGTQVTDGFWVDVDTGDNENMSLFFISADLAANDSVYTAGYYSSYVINETVPDTYPGGPRQTNHLNITMEQSGPSYYAYSSQNFYWDKTTGTLTRFSIMANQTSSTITEYSVTAEITESSIWVIPEFAGLLQTLFLLISLSLAAFVCGHKSRKNKAIA